MEPPANWVSPAGIQDCVSRTLRRQKSGLHRIDRELQTASITPWHRAMGALGSGCGCRNLFSRHGKPAPLSAQRQHETVIETLCEVAPQKGGAPGGFATNPRLFYGSQKRGNHS
jgi:hypothetical protein